MQLDDGSLRGREDRKLLTVTGFPVSLPPRLAEFMATG